MNNAWAWKEREKRKERAVAMTNNIDAHYKGLVRHSIDNSRIYSPSDADRLIQQILSADIGCHNQMEHLKVVSLP